MKKKEQNKELAKQILKRIGGENNISFFTHCMTRLRFNLKDHALVQKDELENIQGVLGVVEQSGQLQVIIGNTVADVYDELCKEAGLEKENALDEQMDDVLIKKKKINLGAIFEVFSACFAPIVAALAGAGILKGIMTLCTNYGWLATDSGIYTVFNAAADATFYFLPFLLAFTCAKKFKTNEILAMVLAGIYMYPTIIEGAGTQISFFGMKFYLVKYASSVLPIMISVWLMSYLYKWLQTHVMKSLRSVIVPIVVLAVMAPLDLVIIGPLGYNLGNIFGEGIRSLFEFSAVFGGIIYGAARQLLVFTGTHMALAPIIINNIETLGYDILGPVSMMSTYAVAGTCFGAFLKTKKSENKTAAFSTFISAFIGITEPALYGMIFRFKKLLIPVCIGGAVGGAFVAAFGAKVNAFVMSSLLSLPAYAGSIPTVLVGTVISFTIAAVIAYMIGMEEKTEEK